MSVVRRNRVVREETREEIVEIPGELMEVNKIINEQITKSLRKDILQIFEIF